jgi:hypothetical protein
MRESQDPRPSRHRRRIVLALLAVLVPIVPIVIALTLTGATVHTATAARAQPRTSPYTPVVRTHSAPTVHHASTTALPGGSGALVGYLLAPESLRSAPGGGGHTIGRLTTRTSFGSAETVLVRRVRGHWLGVVNVAVGNNRLGWIPSSPGSTGNCTRSSRATSCSSTTTAAWCATT